jgi:nucleoside-diphosphate-sugar epimerase
LDDWLTSPRQVLVDFIRTVASPLVILGAGGKMGPTLAVLAQRAAQAAGHRLEVIAVSRFSDASSRQWLELHGVSTVKADLLERSAVQGLPEATHVIYAAGLKFGTQQNPALTWAVNTLAPAHVADRYAKARLDALSTGNVYPLVSVASGGAREDHPLTPLGEYANAAVARERIFEYFARKNGTPAALLRLNYAVELRYGVLVDIVRKVWSGEPIDLSSGWFNCIWQGDANEVILRALALAESPAAPWNLTSPNLLRVREVAERLGELLGTPPQFTGQESETALLNNSAKLCSVLGEPPTPLEAVLRWTAHWVKSGGRSLNKPTHFEARDGRY